jgi:methylenetetrahydrofolate dehydrogenase (NADP+)/methenyltetrahydrofolate cyclohydrolase
VSLVSPAGPVSRVSPAVSLGGKELAASIRTLTAASIASLETPPVLMIVTATEDEASAWYVRSLAKAAGKIGIECTIVDLGPSASVPDLAATLEQLSANPSVHGIILQTPLPEGARLAELAGAIDPAKDVDGANPLSLGRLAVGLPAFAPATAAAVIELLDHHQVGIRGARVVVVGRSAVVGKPVAHLLLNRDATVTVCHSRTPDLASVTRSAEILVVAAGRAGLIGAGHIAPGAVVVDVGTNATPDGGLAGDVSADAADVAGAITPVPGGVGPVTTAVLLRHVVDAVQASARRSGVRLRRGTGHCDAGQVMLPVTTRDRSCCDRRPGARRAVRR